MTTVEVESNKPRLQCRDCPFNTMSVKEFSDHIEVCPVDPVTHTPDKEEGGEA